MAEQKLSDLQQGQELEEFPIGTVGQMNLVRYAGASGDFNPIHNDRDYAVDAGLPGTIAHGMLIKAYIARYLPSLADPSQLISFSTKFKAMTHIGENITIRARVKKKDDEEKIITILLEATGDNGEVKAESDARIQF